MTAIAQTAYVPAAPPQRAERVVFCTRCAATSEEPESQLLPYGFDRVCDRCGMGVRLSAPRKALPAPGAAFLVVARDGRVSAVSEPAEHLMGEEAALIDTVITNCISSPDGDERFIRAISRAAGGGREVTDMRAVAAGPGARRLGPLRVRIAGCGPPRAALLVLEHGAR